MTSSTDDQQQQAGAVTPSAQTDALIIVDVQNDFALPTGSLSVGDAESIIPAINSLSRRKCFKTQVASQDWHPEGHASFTSSGGPWPTHCVQGSTGAELHPALDTRAYHCIIRKGTDARADSYSAFCDEGGVSTGLGALLRGLGIQRVFVCGLAFDFCVSFTAKDAVKEGFEAYLVEDLCRAVAPENCAEHRVSLASSGVRVITQRSLSL